MEVADRHGNPVRVGSSVRLLYIDPRVMQNLPEEEVVCVASMLNDVLYVYEIRNGTICVEKNWDRGNGMTESHLLTVSGNDVEWVDSPVEEKT